MDSLIDLLRHITDQYAGRPAMVYRATGFPVPLRWTYADLADRSRRCAAWLRQEGIRPGDRVAIWSPNRPEWAAAFFGILGAGGVVVPLDVRSSSAFVERVQERSAPVLRFIDGDVPADQVGAGVRTVALADLEAFVSGVDPLPWEEMAKTGDTLAELVFTSGTTGTPKGVMLTHGNITANVEDAQDVVPRFPHYNLLAVLPLSHMFEQTGGFLTALMKGAKITYVSTLQPALLFETMEAEGVNLMCVVPQVLQLFMRGIEREVERTGRQRIWGILHAVAARSPRPVRRLLFRSLHKKLGGQLQAFICGGAYLDPALAQKWVNLGIDVYQGYGTTEAAPVVSTNTQDALRWNSVGRPLRRVEVQIAPDGEILVRGPNVTSGYWGDDEATRQAFEGGWYRTGDLGQIDREGYLYLKGRKKNMIALPNGLNVYPEDIENVLLRVDGVRDAQVLGVIRRGGDTDIVAALVLEEGAADKAPGIVREANSHLAPHQRIRAHYVWPEEDFPRTHTLKARRPEIERRVCEALGVEAGR